MTTASISNTEDGAFQNIRQRYKEPQKVLECTRNSGQ